MPLPPSVEGGRVSFHDADAQPGVLRTGGEAERDYSEAGAVLADLPGLIQGQWPHNVAWKIAEQYKTWN